jgi:hypothetical protein
LNPCWAIITSDYLNAWGLADLIRSSGWPGRIICLRRGNEPSVLMSLYGRGVEVWKVPASQPVVDFLAARIPLADRKWFFFTEERSLQEIWESKSHPWLSAAVWYPNEPCSLNEILDRFAFYEFIRTKALGCVPRTVSGQSDPFAQFGDNFFFRYKVTWVRGKKTPRIRLVSGRSDWEAAVRSGEAQGYGAADWCYQEVLSLAPEDNISVCGWHDAKTPRYVATRKVLQFPARQGNGDVCELIKLPELLAKTTEQLLGALNYTGPFELEFIRDAKRERYYLIELNPRFWMQHPLAGANLGQAIVGRYLGLLDKSVPNQTTPRYWVNTVVALNRLMRTDFRGWKYLRDPQAIRMPPLAVTLRWLPRFSVNLALRQVRPS